MKKNKLNIPIYLNEKIVFDMMAIIEDGFSQFVTVNSSKEDLTENKGHVNSSMGLNKLSFLSVKLSAGLSNKEGQQKKEQETTQKTHTSTSIFQKFYDYLYENELVSNIKNKGDFKVGDFVEFNGTFRKNPILSLIESFQQIFEIITAMETPGKNKKKNNKELINQLNALSKGLQNNNKIDLICNVSDSDYIEKVVIPVDLDCFISKDTNEVVEGEFKVIGKVIKFVDSNDSINLLRNTSFSKLKSDLLSKMFESFNSPEMEKSGLEIEEIITEINGPSIMIIPIAIFI